MVSSTIISPFFRILILLAWRLQKIFAIGISDGSYLPNVLEWIKWLVNAGGSWAFKIVIVCVFIVIKIDITFFDFVIRDFFGIFSVFGVFSVFGFFVSNCDFIVLFLFFDLFAFTQLVVNLNRFLFFLISKIDILSRFFDPRLIQI